MTREEALEELDTLCIPRDGEQDRLADAFDMAIEALKAEPCADCVSRQAVFDLLQMRLMPKEEYKAIYELPSVTPAPRIGRWITDRCDMYICSKCNHTYTDLSGERYGMNFCPNCGAKMEVDE